MYRFIDNQNSAQYHRNIKVSKYITYILSLIFILSINNEYTVNYINTYTDQTSSWFFDDDSKKENVLAYIEAFVDHWGQ